LLRIDSKTTIIIHIICRLIRFLNLFMFWFCQEVVCHPTATHFLFRQKYLYFIVLFQFGPSLSLVKDYFFNFINDVCINIIRDQGRSIFYSTWHIVIQKTIVIIHIICRSICFLNFFSFDFVKRLFVIPQPYILFSSKIFFDVEFVRKINY